MRKIPNVENINESRRKCALCTYESSKEEMLLHFQVVHDVKVENVELNFIDFEAFNECSNAIKHKDDGTSVDAWVNEMESKNDSCILFYKPQGVTSAMWAVTSVSFIWRSAGAVMDDKWTARVVVVLDSQAKKLSGMMKWEKR
ncbi:hypothetical protein TNCV_2322711 [Trichonephila clavipes]|nr:hypothetical protein TNCV_2322711 [Trichonephila clavipes]